MVRSAPPAPIQDEVNANPTKELFIDSLIRDVDLQDAIEDLVDNSVDAARRWRGSGSYAGLYVRIRVSRSEFRLSDNCGGFDFATARDFAWRIGRDPRAPAATRVKHSVGQFGVGMKRALFKIGRDFVVTSRTAKDSWTVRVNLADWTSPQKSDQWTFPIENVAGTYAQSDWGTDIVVRELNETVAQEFATSGFEPDLIRDLGEVHQFALVRGLVVQVGKNLVEPRRARLRQSGKLRPAVKKWKDSSGARVALYAGLDHEPDKAAAGWSVFCNGRLVLKGDKNLTTGWGEPGIPTYHAQYSRFRGFALFESDDPSLLPWNTSKTGVEAEHPLYKSARRRMVNLMKPILQYLDQYKVREASVELTGYLRRQPTVPITELRATGSFKAPKLKTSRHDDDEIEISYSRPRELVEEAKQLMHVRTPKTVGERTFDSYLRSHRER